MAKLPDRDLLAHAVEVSPDGVVIVDGGGAIVYANHEMLRLAGADQLVGRNVDDLVPADRRGSHAQHREAYNSHPSVRPMGDGLELEMVRDDGDVVPVEISLSPFDQDGTYVIAAVRDISARQRDRRRLAAADQQLALIAERERIGRDLHDVVLQRLYGMGLGVQAIATTSDSATAARLDETVEEIDRVISEVRTIVFTLGNAGTPGSLGKDITEVVAQATRVLGFTPTVRVDGPVESVMSDEVQTEMISSMREALGNVARHAHASTVDVVISTVGDRVELTVTDDGVGPPDDPQALVQGNGLVNLARRAEAFGGGSRLARNTDRGATLFWSVPY